MNKHPMQPVAFDQHGVLRFVENRIVSFLLEQYRPGLNDLCMRFDDPDDYEQLMMLIGYSVSGFGELAAGGNGLVRGETADLAEALKPVNQPPG